MQYQQQITVFQQEINNLRLQIQQLQNSGSSQLNIQAQQYQTEIANLRQQLAQLEAQLKNQSSGTST